MYLMYVDESGDSGLFPPSPSRYFILSGLVVHEFRWQEVLNQLVDFRRQMRTKFGLLMREEIHAAKLINAPGTLECIKKHDRLTILREFVNCLGNMEDLNVLVVIVDKQSKNEGYDVFANAWKTLIQRFQNTIYQGNFPGPKNREERGIILADDTDKGKLIRLLRRMRHYNPIPNQASFEPSVRNLRITHVVEDPNFRKSDHSYFIQAVDMTAWLVLQGLLPCRYMNKKGGNAYYKRLDSIYCTVASRNDERGFVRL